MPERKQWTSTQVVFFYPNLIGYLRFVALGFSLVFAMNKDLWPYFLLSFGMSYFLDVFDGKAARAFDQCTKYGAALDMVCDRASNATEYMILSTIYPNASFAFYLCFLLDFGSHWLQFQASAASGSHHKSKDASVNWLVSLYYNNDTVFRIVVGGAEVGTAFLYVIGQS